jgi:hypothetical protein
MKLFAAAVLALVVPASAAAALEVKLSVVPASPKRLSQTVVQLRPYWPYKRPNGSCCRLVPADVQYPFKVQAVSPAGHVFRIAVHKTRNHYVWSGSFRFSSLGLWTIRAPQWGPRYSRNYGARPRIAVTVSRRTRTSR